MWLYKEKQIINQLALIFKVGHKKETNNNKKTISRKIDGGRGEIKLF